MKATKLTTAFDAVLDHDDQPHGKPYPDIFLHAAKKLKVLPRHCLVFEDANQGIKAAKRARMQVVGIVPEDIPDFLGNIKKITDFRDVSVK